MIGALTIFDRKNLRAAFVIRDMVGPGLQPQGLVAYVGGFAVNVAAHPDEVTDLVRETNGRSFAETVNRIRRLGR